MAASLVDRLRRPEYTGENRCLPCTVLNAALALLASTAVALVAPVALAAVVLLAALLAIYLRGYLVPGTPALTGRYLPERVHRALGTRPVAGDHDWEAIAKHERHREGRVDPADYLTAAGVVREDGDDTRLAPSFVEAVRGRVDDPGGVGRRAIAGLYGVEAADVEPTDDDHPAFTVGLHVRRWPSETALATDVAAHRVLAERTDDWTELPVEQRRRILESLRSLHDACPSCGGAIDETSETVESCCHGGEVHTLSCEACGDRLHEFDPTAAELSTLG